MPSDVFPLVAGTALPIDVQIQDDYDNPVTSYGPTTPLSAVVWPGGNRATSFNVAATWTDASRGQIGLTIQPVQTIGLAAGRYRGELTVHDPILGPVIGYAWWIDLIDAPGSGSPPPSYCGYDDLKSYARSWLPALLSDDDEAGFARQRGRARSWLDDLILSRYPAQGYAMMGDPGYGAIAYGGSSIAPNAWLRSQLDANRLIARDWVVEATAKKAIAFICEGQIGPDEGKDGFTKLAARYHNQAMTIALCSSAEIATDAGQAFFAINLGGGSVR